MEENNFWEHHRKEIIFHEDKLNIIESCVDRHAKFNTSKPALIFQDEKGKKEVITYLQLHEQVNRYANVIDKLIHKNSRVFIFLPKISELYISLLAVIKQGSIAAPLFEAFQTQGLEMRLERGEANLLITNKELSERLKRKIPGMKIIIVDSNEFKSKIKNASPEFKPVLKKPKDTALMMFTSSTAGTPVAGIMIPHQALIQQHFTAKYILDLKQEDNYWCTAHPGWVTGTVYGILAPLSIGASIYILTSHFDATEWIKFLQENKISVMYTAPTALRMLKSEIKSSHLKNVRVLASVGEALDTAAFNHYKKLGIQIQDTYWQTETGAMVIGNTLAMKKIPGSMGKAIPGITIKIINKTIHIKPDFPALMTGIYKHEKMYESYFTNYANEVWFKTNDLAKIKDKYVFFEAREDDIIKVSGERISPIEIESALMKHAAVNEAAVIGVPDKIKGNILKAFIVLNEKAKPDEKLKQTLMDFVKQEYAGHSYPKIIEFVKSLPKTNSGKIIRMKLREMEKTGSD